MTPEMLAMLRQHDDPYNTNPDNQEVTDELVKAGYVNKEVHGDGSYAITVTEKGAAYLEAHPTRAVRLEDEE